MNTLKVLAAWAVLGSACCWGDINRWDDGTLIPGTQGITPGPGVNLSGWNTTGHTLEYAKLGYNLTSASFANSDLSDVLFPSASATLTGADFTNATIQDANFSGMTAHGFTSAQFYSTASYQQHSLATYKGSTSIDLSSNNLSGWDFSGQYMTFASLASSNLTNANLSGAYAVAANVSHANFTNANLTGTSFYYANITGANFTGAIVTGADFSGTDAPYQNPPYTFTASQLYSTASYKAHDLSGILLAYNNLSGWNLSGQNLRNSSLSLCNLTGANLSGASIQGALIEPSAAQLYSTASYIAHDLTGVDFSYADMTGWNLSNQDFTNGSLFSTTLTGVNFSGTIINNVNFSYSTGFTANQLYSTASYINRNLDGINFFQNDLSGWNFSGMSLVNSNFNEVNLSGASLAHSNLSSAYLGGLQLSKVDLTGANLDAADFSSADLRGAIGFSPISSTVTTNTIFPDGHIHGLQIYFFSNFTIHDNPIPITVDTSVSLETGGVMTLLLDKNWKSTIYFAPDLNVVLGGTLDLELDPDVNPSSLMGTTLQLFVWNSSMADNHFTEIDTDPALNWDLSRLYVDGTVRIAPECGTMGVGVAAVTLLGARRRRKN